MKSIIDRIYESYGKYAISYRIGSEKNQYFSNDYKSELNKLKNKGFDPEKDFYIVFKGAFFNYSEPESVVQWGGTRSYISNIYDRYKKGDKTDIKQREFEHLEKTHKDEI